MRPSLQQRLPGAEGPPEGCSTAPRHAACGGPIPSSAECRFLEFFFQPFQGTGPLSASLPFGSYWVVAVAQFPHLSLPMALVRTPLFWDRRGPLSDALLPLSLAYAAATYAVEALRPPPRRSQAPVVCVGAAVAGGAGKTPLVLALAERLLRPPRSHTPHILTRGYGGSERGPLRVAPEVHSAARVGDEARLLSRTAPTWVCADRWAGASAACASATPPSVLLMDDGAGLDERPVHPEAFTRDSGARCRIQTRRSSPSPCTARSAAPDLAPRPLAPRRRRGASARERLGDLPGTSPSLPLSLSPSLSLSLSLGPPKPCLRPACTHAANPDLPRPSGRVLPAGPLREPFHRSLARADAVVVPDSPRFAEIRRDSPRSLCDADAALSPLPSRPPSMSEPAANQLPVHGQSGALAAGRRRFALARRAALDAHPSNPASAREERCGCAPSSPRPRLSARSPRQPSSAREAPNRRPDAASRP